MITLTDYDDTEETYNLISICKSNSGITGTTLRLAHRRLGGKIAKMIEKEHHGERFTVVCLMRSGECFGEGIANELDCPLLFLDEKHDVRWKMALPNPFIDENAEFIEGATVILADAVVNTGETIKDIYDVISRIAKRTIIASNVVQKDFRPDDREVFCVRLSDNRFKGTRTTVQEGNKGPDTGDRLFRTLVVEQ